MTHMPDHPYAQRQQRLREALADAVGAQFLVVSDLVNVRYLSGFTGSNASLLIMPDDVALVTDGRYVDQAAAETTIRVVVGRDTVPVAVAEAAGHDAAQVALEADHVSWAQWDRLRQEIAVELLPTRHLVEGLRRCKDPGEVELLRTACSIISTVLESLVTEIRPGLSERHIARRLQDLVYEHSGDGLAFDTIVASGPHSAIPHHDPTDRIVEMGDLLKIDCGALYHGYHSDLTRTFVVGAAPTPEQQSLYDAVAQAAAAARDLVSAGTPVADADAAARAVLTEAGFGERFTHGLGHGVGLQIHEAPMLGRGMPDTMEPGDVLTIEPGAYVPGFGGVRVEDTLAVTDDGAECLTTVTRELIRLG